jgi:bifunctional pyridoxal-dependent enzyme with beta-cystathionase and maltose regulon repressor activities
LQKQAELIGEWLQENDPKYGTTGKEISSNLTDKDSAKMKTAHGVIQGYNSHALIDGKHQVIIHGEAFGGPGFVRLSFACPQSTLAEALTRMGREIEKHIHPIRLKGTQPRW